MMGGEEKVRPVPRCQVHGLALGPEGHCILCRRGALKPPRPGSHRSRTWLVLLCFGLLLSAAGGGFYLKKVRVRSEVHSPQPQPAPSAAPAVTPAVVKQISTRAPPQPAPHKATPPPQPAPHKATPPLHPRWRVPVVNAPTAPRERLLRQNQQRREDLRREREALAARRRMDRLYQQAARGDAARLSITFYMTDWCPACRKGKAWLQQNNLRYRSVNVDQDRAGALELRRLSRGSLPTLVVNNRVLAGFSASKWAEAIQSALRR